MGRRPNPHRRTELLDEILAYIGENGLGELSLRPLARALGTSTYTLTYQFGSKDELVVAAVEHALECHFGIVEDWVNADPDVTPVELVRLYWDWLRDDANLRLVRLLVEAVTLARSQPELFGVAANTFVGQWTDVLSGRFQRFGLAEPAAAALATQVHAMLVGLQLDLMATGDWARLEPALDELCLTVAAATGRPAVEAN